MVLVASNFGQIGQNAAGVNGDGVVNIIDLTLVAGAFGNAADGRLVRRLDLGHQLVGLYESRSRAAYWDGRNALGEPVASGVYFYTLTAGTFTATRKMLIRK